MPQRISDEELKIEIAELSPICADRGTSCIHCDALEILLDLRDARAALRLATDHGRIAQLTERLKLAVEALEFYRNSECYRDVEYQESAIMRDFGARARDALDRIKEIG